MVFGLFPRKPQQPAPAATHTIRPVSPTLIEIDRSIETPQFMLSAEGTFNRPLYVWYRYEGEHITPEHLKPQAADDPHAVGRMLSTFIRSGTWERARRGFKTQDDAGNPLSCSYRSEGVVIDRIRREDGSTVTIVGYDIAGPLPYEEFQAAIRQDVTGESRRWLGQYQDRDEFQANRDRSRIAYCPIFRLKLREVVTTADEPPPPQTNNPIRPDRPDDWL